MVSLQKWLAHFLYIFLLFMYEQSKGLGGKNKEQMGKGEREGEKENMKNRREKGNKK